MLLFLFILITDKYFIKKLNHLAIAYGTKINYLFGDC